MAAGARGLRDDAVGEAERCRIRVAPRARRVNDRAVSEITDDYMRQMMTTTKPYTVLILRKGPNYGADGSAAVIWEHGRRNFELRADGRLSIVLPVPDESDVTGIGIFALAPEETEAVMRDDPGVQAGLFEFEVHAARSFPGDALP